MCIEWCIRNSYILLSCSIIALSLHIIIILIIAHLSIPKSTQVTAYLLPPKFGFLILLPSMTTACYSL